MTRGSLFDDNSARRISSSVRWTEARRGTNPVNRSRPRPVRGETITVGGGGRPGFMGVLSRWGPFVEGQPAPDFTDWRYWVRELRLSLDDDVATFDTKPDGRHIWAINLEEKEIPPEDQHAITKLVSGIINPGHARYVFVEQLTMSLKPSVPPVEDEPTTGKVWVFSSYPGQIVPGWSFIVRGLDSMNCPIGDWVRTDGPAIVQDQDPP